jgi:hypothetical protein
VSFSHRHTASQNELSIPKRSPVATVGFIGAGRTLTRFLDITPSPDWERWHLAGELMRETFLTERELSQLAAAAQGLASWD